MPDIPQASVGFAEESSQFDFCAWVTVAPTSTAVIKWQGNQNVIRVRSINVTDVTAPRGVASTPATIACYFRIDGQTASANTLPDGSSSRVLYPGGSIGISRWCDVSNGVTLYNPNGTSIGIQVAFGA